MTELKKSLLVSFSEVGGAEAHQLAKKELHLQIVCSG